ncbi:MAG: BrnT family toxin [Selenomonadaceae bacterium]|nr:BrnT family toxin [Selenomonadaceae bacterium]
MGEFSFKGFEFEWDDEKYQINIKKHGIYFEDAARVFFDDNAVYYSDNEHSIDEERFKIVGMVENILAVIYTERGEKNRIISARPADKFERNDYYGQFSIR